MLQWTSISGNYFFIKWLNIPLPANTSYTLTGFIYAILFINGVK